MKIPKRKRIERCTRWMTWASKFSADYFSSCGFAVKTGPHTTNDGSQYTLFENGFGIDVFPTGEIVTVTKSGDVKYYDEWDGTMDLPRMLVTFIERSDSAV